MASEKNKPGAPKPDPEKEKKAAESAAAQRDRDEAVEVEGGEAKPADHESGAAPGQKAPEESEDPKRPKR